MGRGRYTLPGRLCTYKSKKRTGGFSGTSFRIFWKRYTNKARRRMEKLLGDDAPRKDGHRGYED